MSWLHGCSCDVVQLNLLLRRAQSIGHSGSSLHGHAVGLHSAQLNFFPYLTESIELYHGQSRLSHHLIPTVNSVVHMVQALVDLNETSMTLQAHSTLLTAGEWVADVPLCSAAGFQLHGSCRHPPLLTTL